VTALDRAFEQMQAAPDDTQLRRAYYTKLALSEVFVPLEEGSDNAPLLIESDGLHYALAFDSEARLAAFFEAGQSRAVMSGRALARGLIGAQTGIGLNLGVADTAMLIPPEAIEWVTGFETSISVDMSRIVSIEPAQFSEKTLAALDTFFATLEGAAQVVHCATGIDEANARASLFVFENANPSLHAGITQQLAQSLAMLEGIENAVVVFDPQDALLTRLHKVALSIALPEPRVQLQPAIPGSDPSKPPKLR
jgi:hypothetical protein